MKLNILTKYEKDDAELDVDLDAKLQKLREDVIKHIRKNAELTNNQKEIERKIGLLIQNRTSIHEIDRDKKKQENVSQDKGKHTEIDFSKNEKMIDNYGTLFYLLQTNPKYISELADVLHNNEADFVTNVVLLTLYGDAFSTRE
jgi:hypothetical protein